MTTMTLASCSACGTSVDLDSYAVPHLEMDDGCFRCFACRQKCAICGEWITDYRQTANLADVVAVKAVPLHYDCAANDMLEWLLELKAEAVEDFDPLTAAHIRSIRPESLTTETIETLWEFSRRRG